MDLSRALQQLTQFFLTSPCPLCQRPASDMAGDILCIDCYRQLCTCRWSDLPPGHTTTSSTMQTSIPIFPWGQYRGILKQALARLKYGNQADLGIWLGCQLAQHWQHTKSYSPRLPKPVVIPVPLHDERLKQRGYNQAALIAKGFCKVTGFSLAAEGLQRTKATAAMHSLGPYERQQNLTGAFQIGKGLPPRSRPILLIDDIYTTGTTAHAAATPLMQAGYTIAGIATVARAVFYAPPPEESHAPFPYDQTLNPNPTQ